MIWGILFLWVMAIAVVWGLFYAIEQDERKRDFERKNGKEE